MSYEQRTGPVSEPAETVRQRGFNLVQMLIILASLSALVVALTYKTSDYFNKRNQARADAVIAQGDAQLRQYIAATGRLPCPDTTGDGLSNDSGNGCVAQKGSLPYRTLGMPSVGYGYGEVPMLYGVQQSGSLRFANRTQTFSPVFRTRDNKLRPLTISQRNVFDFCATLDSMRTASLQTGGLLLQSEDGVIRRNAVYALAIAGAENRDARGAGWDGITLSNRYDGVNATSSNAFLLPQTPLTPIYDDRTFFRDARQLYAELRCEALNGSITLLVETSSIEGEVVDLAESNAGSVEVGLILNSVQIVMGIWQLGQTVALIAQAAEEVALSASLLAGVSAACAIPPWVACAMIPVYAGALATASTGAGLAAAAAVTAGIQVGLSATSVALYDNLSSRTAGDALTNPASTLNPSLDAAAVAERSEAYLKDLQEAVDAYQATLPPPGDISTRGMQRDAAEASIASRINAVGDSGLRSVLADNVFGRTESCQPGSSGCQALEVPLTIGANGAIATEEDENGNTVPKYQTLYVRDRTAPNAPGVESALVAFYQQQASASAAFSAGEAPSAEGITTEADAEAFAAQQQAQQAAQEAAAAGAAAALDAAMRDSNRVTAAVSSMFGAVSAFDQRHLAFKAAERTLQARQDDVTTARARHDAIDGEEDPDAKAAARQTLDAAESALSVAQADYNLKQGQRSTALAGVRDETGLSSWDYSGGTSLCGSSQTSSQCGWMSDRSASAGNDDTHASSRSSELNGLIEAVSLHEAAKNHELLLRQAEGKADAAWASRNAYKTGLCSREDPPRTFVGGSDFPSNNPALWDALGENLGAGGPVGLNCGNGVDPIDQSAEQDAAAAAERERVCDVDNARYDAQLCALYSGQSPDRTTIRGVRDITNAIIQKGISE